LGRVAPRTRRELAQTIVIRAGEFLWRGCPAAKGIEQIPSELAADRMNGFVTVEAFIHQAGQCLANRLDTLGKLGLDDDVNGCMQRVA